jgi:hypothetical protein
LAWENSVFYTLYIEKEEIAETKNDHTTRKSLRHISLVRAWSLRMSEKTSKLVQNRIRIGIRQILFKRLAQENGVYTERTNGRNKN